MAAKEAAVNEPVFVVDIIWNVPICVQNVKVSLACEMKLTIVMKWTKIKMSDYNNMRIVKGH